MSNERSRLVTVKDSPFSKVEETSSGNGDSLKEKIQHVAEAVRSNGDALKEKLRHTAKAVRSTELPLRVLAIFGGSAMVVSSVSDLFEDLLTLNLSDAIIEFYCMLFGVAMILLESDKRFSCSAKFEEFVHNYVTILAFVSGRGIFYFFAGTLKLTQFNMFNALVGFFSCFVGILYYLTGVRTAQKLEKIRGGILTHIKLRMKFDVADVDGTGDLNYHQFCNLVKSIGLELSQSEVELAFHQLDVNKNERISYEEVKNFWEGYKFETEQNETV